MFFKTLGTFVARFWLAIILFWIALTATLYMLAPKLGQVASSEETNFLPEQSDSVLAKKLLDRYFPNDSFNSRIVLIAEKPAGLADEDLQWLDKTANALAHDTALKNVGKVLTPVGTPFLRSKLVSPDGRAALAVLYLTTNFISRDTQKTVTKILKGLERPPAGVTLAATGDAVVGSDYHRAIGYSLDKTTWATLIMLIAILIFIFRSPITPLIPLVSIVASFIIAKSVAAFIATTGVVVSPLTEIFLIVVVFGAGSNYCVFLIFRYFEEISRGKNCHEAVATSVQTVGQAISSSALTVIIGLGSLVFAQFGPFSQTGPYVALGVAIALCAGLTLTPSLILALRKILFWPSGSLHHELEPAAWKRVVSLVTRRPLAVLLFFSICLSPLIYYGLQAQRSFDFLRELPEEFPARRGMDILKSHFNQGEMSPLVLVLENKERWDNPAGLDQLYQLTSALAAHKEIREVRSAVWPTGDAKLLEAGLLINQVEKINIGLQRLVEGNQKIHDGIDQIHSKVKDFQKQMAQGAPADAKTVVPENTQTSAQIAKVRQDLDKAIANIATYQQDAQKKEQQGGFFGAAAKPEYEKAIAKLETLRNGLVQIRDGVEKLGKKQEHAQAEISQLQEALGRLSEGTERMSSGLQQISAATQHWVEPHSPAQSALKRLIVPNNILERQPKLRDAFEYYISPDGLGTRLMLVLNAVPYSEQEKRAIITLRTFVRHGARDIAPGLAQAHFAGSASTIMDERIVTDKDFYRIIGYVLTGIFLILLLLLQELLAPIYLIGTMIFSYFVSLGITSLVFEHAYQQQGLDWKVPFFMFVLLVALGEDYNIFLMARIKEERNKIGVLQGVQTATIRTGPLITYCGLIMAGTFLSLMLSPLEALLQLGFGITVGVLLDTFIVRPLLVPSIVLLVDRWTRLANKFSQTRREL